MFSVCAHHSVQKVGACTALVTVYQSHLVLTITMCTCQTPRASKTALNQMVVLSSRELAPQGITSVILHPGESSGVSGNALHAIASSSTCTGLCSSLNLGL
jgi:hypothetical protein